VYYSDNRVVEKRTVDVVTFGRTTENLKNCSRWMLIFESRKSKKIGQYARWCEWRIVASAWPAIERGRGGKVEEGNAGLCCAVLNTSMLKVVENEEKIPEGHLGVFG